MVPYFGDELFLLDRWLECFFDILVNVMCLSSTWYFHCFLGGPVGAHMIARAAYRSQVPLHERTVVNEWKVIEGTSPNRIGRLKRRHESSSHTLEGLLDWTL
jgi:hypothetical protein